MSRITHIKKIADALFRSGYSTYLVGGAVRDMQLGLPPGDLDLATDARPEAVVRTLRNVADNVLEVGAAFGTVVAVFGDERYEITTFRGDVYDGETRKPEVTYTDTIEEDLGRRDFTINAMAIDVRDPDSKVIDPFGGLKDLREGVLRTPGDTASSFRDDPLRMVRAARFIARFGLKPAERSSVLSGEPLELVTSRLAPSLGRVSSERLRDELCKLLSVEDPTEGLDFLGRTGLSDVFFPELNQLRMEDEKGGYKDVYTHTFAVVRNTDASNLRLRLSALFHDIAKPDTFARGDKGKVSFHRHEVLGAGMTEDRMKALKFDNALTADVVKLVRLHLRAHTAEAWTDKTVRRYIKDAGPLLQDLNDLQRADVTTKSKAKAEKLSKRMDDLEERIAHIQFVEGVEPIKPPLDGKQVMEFLGLKPGPDVGKALAYLLDVRLDYGPMTDEEARGALLDWRNGVNQVRP